MLQKQKPDTILLCRAFYLFTSSQQQWSRRRFEEPQNENCAPENSAQFRMGHESVIKTLSYYYFLAAMIVSATLFGTISYRKNSMVNPARPSVIERRFVV